MNFWDGEQCEYCNGRIAEKRTDLPRKVKGRYVLVENVPTGVCKECGARYYAANVLKTLEDITGGRQEPEREILMPVYHM